MSGSSPSFSRTWSLAWSIFSLMCMRFWSIYSKAAWQHSVSVACFSHAPMWTVGASVLCFWLVHDPALMYPCCRRQSVHDLRHDSHLHPNIRRLGGRNLCPTAAESIWIVAWRKNWNTLCIIISNGILTGIPCGTFGQSFPIIWWYILSKYVVFHTYAGPPPMTKKKSTQKNCELSIRHTCAIQRFDVIASLFSGVTHQIFPFFRTWTMDFSISSGCAILTCFFTISQADCLPLLVTMALNGPSSISETKTN